MFISKHIWPSDVVQRVFVHGHGEIDHLLFPRSNRLRHQLALCCQWQLKVVCYIHLQFRELQREFIVAGVDGVVCNLWYRQLVWFHHVNTPFSGKVLIFPSTAATGSSPRCGLLAHSCSALLALLSFNMLMLKRHQFWCLVHDIGQLD